MTLAKPTIINTEAHQARPQLNVFSYYYSVTFVSNKDSHTYCGKKLLTNHLAHKAAQQGATWQSLWAFMKHNNKEEEKWMYILLILLPRESS